ncbi:MAG: FtsW/RodA/SpoVE family cell cycle protein [Solirubrobacteraceae bacterium]
MYNLDKLFLGDKYLWAFIGLLALFSFLPVYSASSNLEYIVGNGSTSYHLIKHLLFLIIGIFIITMIQLVDYKYFGGFAVILLPVIIILLFLTLIQGRSADEDSAIMSSRWLLIPYVGLRFQTSTLASLVLLIYVSRFLTKMNSTNYRFQDTIIPLIFPILLVIGLIFPSNGSTAVILFVICIGLLILGGYPTKYLLIFATTTLILASSFIYFALNTNLIKNTRVVTWKNRIENFVSSEKEEIYQVKYAKAAIVNGGKFGKGPGKSSLKQILPQSSSDFIYAIIIEEYGAIFGVLIIFIFLLILFRIVIIATKIHTIFGSLLTFAVGLPIIFQAFTNMGVAVNLFPVTGQPLPMISYGGTSLWITCLSFGIILSVSRSIKTQEEIDLERKKNDEITINDIA